MVAAAGEGKILRFAPCFGGVVDKFAAVIVGSFAATGTPKPEGYGGLDVRQGLESPLMSLAGEGIPANPARSDIGGGQCEDVLAVSGLSAVIAD